VACCSSLGDSFVVELTSCVPGLIELDVSSCSVSDVALRAICARLTALRSLRLAWCRDVTDTGLLGLPDLSRYFKMWLYNTHPFNGPFSGTTRVGRYQKGKTDLDFTEARDSEWHCHQPGRMQVCTSLQTDNHTSTPPLSFLQTGCPSCCPTNSIKALKAQKCGCTN